jgi:hypothetical protein
VCPCRGGKCERGDVAEQYVDAVLPQELGFALDVLLKLTAERLPAAAGLVHVQLEPVVLGDANVERPAWRGHVLDAVWKQPARGISPHQHARPLPEQLARHFGTAHRVAKAMPRYRQRHDRLAVPPPAPTPRDHTPSLHACDTTCIFRHFRTLAARQHVRRGRIFI